MLFYDVTLVVECILLFYVESDTLEATIKSVVLKMHYDYGD